MSANKDPDAHKCHVGFVPNAGDFALSVQLLTRMASLLRLQAQRIRAHRAPLFARHTSTAVFHDPKPLPPPDTWRHVFVSNLSAVRDRASVSNPRTANILARAFLGGKSIVAGKGKTVIESYPGVLCLAVSHWSDVFSSSFAGPGALSRALLTLEDGEVEKLIILEEYGPYLEYLLVCTLLCDSVLVLTHFANSLSSKQTQESLSFP